MTRYVNLCMCFCSSIVFYLLFHIVFYHSAYKIHIHAFRLTPRRLWIARTWIVGLDGRPPTIAYPYQVLCRRFLTHTLDHPFVTCFYPSNPSKDLPGKRKAHRAPVLVRKGMEGRGCLSKRIWPFKSRYNF